MDIAFPTPLAGDPNWNSVVLLCHCDGTSGSTTFTDTSLRAHGLSSSAGGPTVSTSSPKFGTGSGSYSGSNSTLVVSGTLSDFDFQSGQFTLEAWVYCTTAPSSVNAVIATYSGSGSGGGWFFGSIFSSIAFWYHDGSGTLVQRSGSSNIGANAWHFLTADRDGTGTLRMYLDGAVVYSGSDPAFQTSASAPLWIGNAPAGGDYWIGNIDEFRITKGVARYAGAFTPPSAPFPDGGGSTAQARAMIMA